MRTIIKCLREFVGLKEVEQPSYLGTHADFITTNTLTFPDIPHNGSAMNTKSTTLFSYYNRRNKSALDMKNYTDLKAVCDGWMEENYNYVDLIADGDGDIVALAGVRGSSDNTSRIGAPSIPGDVKYVFAENVGEIYVTRAFDKLALGSATVTTAKDGVTVVKSGDTQLKVTVTEPATIFIDIETTIKTLIKNQTEGDKIKSVMANFNANGLSPVASPRPVTVPS